MRSSRPAAVVPTVLLSALTMVAIGIVVVLLPVTFPSTAAARAGDGVKVTVTTLTPSATAGPSSVLHVSGTVSNRGDQAVHSVVVRVRLATTRLADRAALAALTTSGVERDGEVVSESAVPDLEPGTSAPYDLSKALIELAPRSELGVYPLAVEVMGVLGEDAAAQPDRLSLVRTTLPWTPDAGAAHPAGITWVWPLVDAPVRRADGVFVDDSLTADISVGGRLQRLLDAGVRLQQGAGLTWALDPELIETVADMAGPAGYLVAAGTDKPTPGTGALAARAWLAELRVATSGRPLLVLPYADPDVTALVRHGRVNDVTRAMLAGADVITRELPAASVLPGLAWPPSGYLTRSTGAGLAAAGIDSVLLDGRALPPAAGTAGTATTPGSRATLPARAGRLAALLADPAIADELGAVQVGQLDPVLTAQRVLSEAALVAAEPEPEAPAGSAGTSTPAVRTLVAMPPRRWDPAPEFVEQLIGVTSALWTSPVDLAAQLATPPSGVARTGLHYPGAQRRTELPLTYLRALDAMDASIGNFSAILTAPALLVPGLDSSLLRLESSWWRARDVRVNRLYGEQSYLSGLRGSVRVQPGSFTFGSRSGTIPVTVINELSQQVTVVLRLQPQTLGLTLDDVPPSPIGPKQKIQIEVAASAVAGGPVVIDATLYTPAGAQYGQPVQLRVNVTQIGFVALAITVGAAVVLFLTAGIRVATRIRNARRDEGDATPDGDAGDADGNAGDPVHPDNPGATL